jgi:hypothetical protein
MSLVVNTDQFPIAIPLSTRKRILLVAGAFAFVAASIWLWTIADTQTRRSPLLLKGVSIVGGLFFGLCGVYGVSKLFDTQPGLIIDQTGIHNNSSAGAVRLVKWENIQGIRVMQMNRTRFILIVVNNAEELIAQESKWKQKIIRMNMKTYGTPVSISTLLLACKPDTLIKLLTESLEQMQRPGRY